MHVVPSVIAKRVSDLERTMQTQLFNRSTRQVSLTEAGQKFHVHANALVIEFDSVIGSMKRQGDVLEGHLRIKMPTTLTVLYLANVLSAFQREYERITMEVVLVDRSVNPIEEGYDVVVTGLAESYEGVSDLSLCPLEQLVCASPSYFEAKHRPEHPSDLADHDCLVFRPKGPSWQFESPRGPIAVDVPQKLVANDNSMLFAAACAGNGIAVLPTYLAKAHCRSEDGRIGVVAPRISSAGDLAKSARSEATPKTASCRRFGRVAAGTSRKCAAMGTGRVHARVEATVITRRKRHAANKGIFKCPALLAVTHSPAARRQPAPIPERPLYFGSGHQGYAGSKGH